MTGTVLRRTAHRMVGDRHGRQSDRDARLRAARGAAPRNSSAPLAAGEIRIRSIASAVNYSDLQIRAGHWPVRKADPFPYVPGLEVVGDVIEVGGAVDGVRVGDRVIAMMQGLGGARTARAPERGRSCPAGPDAGIIQSAARTARGRLPRRVTCAASYPDRGLAPDSRMGE